MNKKTITNDIGITIKCLIGFIAGWIIGDKWLWPWVNDKVHKLKEKIRERKRRKES